MAASSRGTLMRPVYLALALLCVLSVAGSRKMLRGVPIGNVTEVDSRTGVVQVDLGSVDGVLRGVRFAVVDDRGGQVALVTPAEVYDSMFWSAPLERGEAARVRPGMEARWVFTPELSMMLQARKKGTPEAYREFAAKYPGSVFLPQLARSWPEEFIEKVDPAYYRAWKIYTATAFEEYLEEVPAGPLRAVAEAELKSIKAYEAERELERAERERRAAQFQEEQRRQEEIRAKALERQRLREKEEMHGKLVNNSPEAVRFVFDPPSMLPSTVVQPGTGYEVNHPEGSYTYKVFAVQDEPLFGEPSTEEVAREPLKTGSVDIMFDFWEASYP